MTATVGVRPETEADRAAVRALLERAFGRPDEADLVDRLRADGDLMLSLVAVTPALVGSVALSRLTVTGGAAIRASALAPVAVAPEHQGRGVATALVRAALARLRSDGEHLVLVSGEPSLYGRLGFTREAAAGIETPYDGPFLQALALDERGRSVRGTVVYPRAFAALA